MTTLKDYKKAYKARKTQTGKTVVFNSAMLNLNEADKREFMMWQLSLTINTK